jgi:hypothetical protein
LRGGRPSCRRLSQGAPRLRAGLRSRAAHGMAMNRSKHEAGVALTHGVTCSAGRPELDANTVGRGRRVQQASERRSPWPGENGEVLGGNSACRFGSGPEFRGVARLCKQPATGLLAKLKQHVRETQFRPKPLASAGGFGRFGAVIAEPRENFPPHARLQPPVGTTVQFCARGAQLGCSTSLLILRIWRCSTGVAVLDARPPGVGGEGRHERSCSAPLLTRHFDARRRPSFCARSMIARTRPRRSASLTQLLKIQLRRNEWTTRWLSVGGVVHKVLA